MEPLSEPQLLIEVVPAPQKGWRPADVHRCEHKHTLTFPGRYTECLGCYARTEPVQR